MKVCEPHENTWIARRAVGTPIVSWYGLDQFLEGFLVAHLGALAHCGRHVVKQLLGS